MLADLPTHVGRGKRIIGIDTGSKHIGLALSDPGLRVASAYGHIPSGKLSVIIEQLNSLIMREHVGGIVIGYPLNMDASDSRRSQSARAFARNLNENGIYLPIAFWDERLTTVQARDIMIKQADLTRKKQQQYVDKLAAQIILQSALDYIFYASDDS